MMTFFTLPLAASVWTALQEMSAEIVGDYLADFVGIARVLAALLAAFSVIRFSSSYVEGDSAFGWTLLRPVVILLCVVNFSTICTAFDSLVASVTSKVTSTTDSSFTDLIEVIEEYAIPPDDAPEEAPSGGNWLIRTVREVWEVIRGAVARMVRMQSVGVLSGWAAVTKLICEGLFLVMEILSACYLTLMRLFGPFILAMAIPQMWKSNIRTLVSRYIQVSLWTPVGFICIALITSATKQLAIMMGSSSALASFGQAYFGAVLLVVSVSLITQIPKICGWIVESAGTGGAEQGVLGMIRKAASFKKM